MSVAVASRYARALVDILTSEPAPVAPDQALAQLRTFVAWESESEPLRQILASPAVAAARKRAVIGRLAAEASVAPILRNFLYVLIDHRRIDLLGEIVKLVESQLDEKMGIVRAHITSARPLDAGQQASIEASLAQLTGKRVLGQYAVEESLLGGVVAKVGSRVYDGSVRGQLDSLRSRLVRS